MTLIYSIKVNEYATLLLLPPFLVVGSNLKGKNLLLEEQILSFKSRANFKRLPHPEKLIGNHTTYYYIIFGKEAGGVY